MPHATRPDPDPDPDPGSEAERDAQPELEPSHAATSAWNSACALSKFGYMVIIIDFGIAGRKTLNYIYKGQLDKSCWTGLLCIAGQGQRLVNLQGVHYVSLIRRV